GFDIADLVAKVLPLLMSVLASGDKSRLPSLIEMLDWRRAVPKAKAQPPAATSATEKPAAEAQPAASATVPQDVMVRVAAVLEQLTPQEKLLAAALARELSAEERATWFAELAPLSVDDAVVRVRKLLSGTKSLGTAS